MFFHFQERQIVQLSRSPTSLKIFGVMISSKLLGSSLPESNLTFAIEVEPDNKDLNERLNEVREMRREDKITLPSTISTELKINPFLRCHREEVIEAAQNYSQTAVSKDEEVLGVIRNWKDNF